jgi:hypothetical protein
MPSSRPYRTAAVFAIAALAAASCGGDDSASTATTGPTAVTPPTTEALATTAAPATTEAVSTTQPATTAAPSTTEAPSSGNLAVVWGSGVDSNRVNTALPQPVWVAGETTVVLDIVGLVDNDPSFGQLGEACRETVEFANLETDQCMFVQFRFNVGPNATEQGGVFVSDVVTADGQQIDVFQSEQARAGTVDNGLIFVVPGGGPGSRIFLDITSGVGFDSDQFDIEFVTPDAAEWKPVDFFAD